MSWKEQQQQQQQQDPLLDLRLAVAAGKKGLLLPPLKSMSWKKKQYSGQEKMAIISIYEVRKKIHGYELSNMHCQSI